MDKNFDPVKACNKAMHNSFKEEAPEIAEELESDQAATIIDDEAKLKRQEQARKTRDALLAKNPNHFKELSARAHQKLQQESK